MEQYKTLQNAQTVIGNGGYVITNTIDTLVIAISGTATFTVNFMASIDGISYFLYEGNKLGNSSILGNTTSTLGEGWEFDTTGINYFQASITAISGGYVTIIANGCSTV